MGDWQSKLMTWVSTGLRASEACRAVTCRGVWGGDGKWEVKKRTKEDSRKSLGLVAIGRRSHSNEMTFPFQRVEENIRFLCLLSHFKENMHAKVCPVLFRSAVSPSTDKQITPLTEIAAVFGADLLLVCCGSQSVTGVFSILQITFLNLGH